MDIKHFTRAEEHRETCKSKAGQLETASNFKDAARLWSEFLVEHHRWFTRIQQAFERGPSSAWFGKLKGRRKSDRLLIYLQQARHADEHGLEPIAEVEPGSLLIGVGGGYTKIDKLIMRNGQIVELEGSQDGGPLRIQQTLPHLKLNPVENRGVVYPPPEVAMGEVITALGAAVACVSFMDGVAAEGSEFFKT